MSLKAKDPKDEHYIYHKLYKINLIKINNLYVNSG